MTLLYRTYLSVVGLVSGLNRSLGPHLATPWRRACSCRKAISVLGKMRTLPGYGQIALILVELHLDLKKVMAELHSSKKQVVIDQIILSLL